MSVIVYEYPFNERIRTYLRLEHLFCRLERLMTRDDALDHHYALMTVFEVMDVAARADLKSDVMKDLEKQKHTLSAFRGNPAISEAVLDQIIAQLERGFAALNAMPGKAGQSLSENDWLMSLRSRASIPGGTCEFDLPAYFAWQHHPASTRRADIARWAATLTPLAESVRLLLKLLREAGAARKVMASAGQYQQSLPQGRSVSLLRLSIDPLLNLIPEISGNRLVVSVRLMRQGEDDRLHPSGVEAPFELVLCA